MKRSLALLVLLSGIFSFRPAKGCGYYDYSCTSSTFAEVGMVDFSETYTSFADYYATSSGSNWGGGCGSFWDSCSSPYDMSFMSYDQCPMCSCIDMSCLGGSNSWNYAFPMMPMQPTMGWPSTPSKYTFIPRLEIPPFTPIFPPGPPTGEVVFNPPYIPPVIPPVVTPPITPTYQPRYEYGQQPRDQHYFPRP